MISTFFRHTSTLLLLFPYSSEAWISTHSYRSPKQTIVCLKQRITPSEEERPYYPKARRPVDNNLTAFDQRPGAVIETEEQLAIKATILEELSTRNYPTWLKDYGELQEIEDAAYDRDDPDAIDAATLGSYTIQDIRARFDFEWDPHGDEPDPNIVALNQPTTRYLEDIAQDDDGVDVGYDPIFGPSSPMDRRAILGAKESYMVNDATRDDSMLQPQFDSNDPELAFNAEVVEVRKSLDIIETYVDPFLPEMELPRHVAKWHGYPEQMFFEPKNFTNNRFTEHPTDFSQLTPYRARQRAVEMARSKNAEWLPDGVSQAWHRQQRQPYENHDTLVGTLRKGNCDGETVELIQPALQVLGSCVELLSVDGGVFRFHYHGLMKNKHGMAAWTETLLADCGAKVTGVVFETGFRRRDPAYDGGDPWYGIQN